MRQNLIQRIFNRQIGELEVVTVRTPFGTYDHVSREGGDITSTRKDVEEMQRKNMELYEALLGKLDDNSFVIDSVTSYNRNYRNGNESGTYFRLRKVEDKSHSTSIVGAW